MTNAGEKGYERETGEVAADWGLACIHNLGSPLHFSI